MGKLAVVFFAALAFQAVFGGITKGYGYDREELRDLVRQVVSVSDDVYEIFHNTPLRRGFSWENREFGQELEEIIAQLEVLTTKHDAQTSQVIFNVLRELREVLSYFMELRNTTEQTTMHRLEVALASSIKKVVKSFENFEDIFDVEEFNATFYSHFKTILGKFVFALRNLYENVNTTYQMRDVTREGIYSNKRHYYGGEYYNNEQDIQTAIQKLEVTLERVHFDDILMKRAFMHLVRRYFENMREVLTPEFNEYYQMFFVTKDASFNTQDVKTHIFAFINKFVSYLKQMPETTQVAFYKATLKFESRLELLTEVNTPARQLSIRIQTYGDLLTNWVELLPYHSAEYKGEFKEYGQQLVEIFRKFISKIESVETHPEFISNLKMILTRFEKSTGQYTYVVFFQEFTTEVRKFLMSHTVSTDVKVHVGAEVLDVFEMFRNTYDKVVLVGKSEGWSTYLMALTNKLSLHMRNNIHSDDMHILNKQLHSVLEILEHESHPEFKKLAYALKEIMQEFETERYMINSYLQKISLQINQFIGAMEQDEHLPKNVVQIVSLYTEALEKIHFHQKIIKGFLNAQTPVEIVLKTETVADRVSKLLHVIVPGFKQAKIANRVYYFNQILEVVMYRLRKTSLGYEKSDLVERVYENLHQIQNHLENVLEQTTYNTKVNFAVHIHNAVMEMRKLAFAQHFEGHVDLVKVYGDLLFGLEHLLNEIQFDLQILVQQYPIKTLHLQIESIAHRVSHFLLRTQAKPELKRVVLLQVEALSQEVEYLAYVFKKMTGNHEIFAELAAKYIKIYDELRQVKLVGNKNIEDLTAFLDMHINTIVRDLAYLTSLNQETPEFYEVYKYALITFANIMVRLENVHNNEYYHIVVKTDDFFEYVRRITSKVSYKLQNTVVETEELKYDFALRTLIFAQRLEKIALRFQIEAKVYPKGLYNIIDQLQRVGTTQTVSVAELKSVLNKYVLAAYAEIEKIISQESTVGLKEGLIKYLAAVERLYFNIHSIVVRSQSEESFNTILTRVDMHFHYLATAIEHIPSGNKVALDVLRTEYRRLIKFVTVLSGKFHEVTAHSDRFQHILAKLTEIKSFDIEKYTSVDQLEVKMIETIKHVVVLLKELSWVLYEIPQYQGNSDVKMIFKSFFDEFLTTIQRIHLAVESNVLIQQRSYNYNKWGLTNGKTFGYYGINTNEFSNKYDQGYYGSFTKYFNKYGTNLHKTFGFTKKYGFGKHFGGEYKPTFGGYVSRKYYGDVDRENTKYSNEWKYGKNWVNTPETYNTEWKYGKMWENIPSEFRQTNKGYNFEWSFGKNWENTPSMYHKVSVHKYQYPSTYQYNTIRQYETPEYFGKYTHGSQYETKDLPTLFKNIKYNAQEVSEELKDVKQWAKRDLTVYVRELVQIVDHFVNRFEQQNTNDYKINQLIEAFQQIREELHQLIKSPVTYQTSQVKFQLSNAIEQIVEQLENFVRVEKYSEIQYFNDVFVQFFNYIRNLKYQVKSNVYGGEFKTYNTEFNYNKY